MNSVTIAFWFCGGKQSAHILRITYRLNGTYRLPHPLKGLRTTEPCPVRGYLPQDSRVVNQLIPRGSV